MFNAELGSSIHIHLHNIALYRALENVHYENVISPFSRMYLIEKGQGKIALGDHTVNLKPNHLYLIPSYALCSYWFSNDMVQYYIHFSTSMLEGLNVFDVFENHFSVSANQQDCEKIKQLLALHPDMQLPTPEPAIYQTREWMNRQVKYKHVAQYLETRGILEQLLSRFLFSSKGQEKVPQTWQSNLKPILIYIQNNLHNSITMEHLSNMAFFSKDHFARVFKSVTGFPPVEYVLRKRIEKAQFLLLTTTLPQDKIIEQTGFKSLSYFSKAFKKYTAISPGKYRRQL